MKKLLLAAAMLVVFGGPALAQRACNTHDKMVEVLTEKYGERLYLRVFSPRGFVIEVWGNEDKDTWTFTATNAEGRTCIADAGQSFQVFTASGSPT